MKPWIWYVLYLGLGGLAVMFMAYGASAYFPAKKIRQHGLLDRRP